MINAIAKKRFGQNFLQDDHVIARIIAVIAPKNSDYLIEIGPGLGALTQKLESRVKQLDVIEIDKELIAPLQAQLSRTIIHQADALQFDFHTLHQVLPSRVIGNLPYNISTPLLFHLLQFKDMIHDMVFMLQEEVVDRIVATPNSKAYGRLSVVLQYYCAVEKLFTVPPTAFYPQPKVNSAIIRLTPRLNITEAVIDPIQFEQLVKLAFVHRRKTIRNNLKHHFTDADLINLHIDPQMRPEQLTISQFIHLSNLNRLLA